MNQQIVPSLRELGLNIIPLKPKSKTPSIPWKQYQNESYLDTIPNECNLGIVCGRISKNLVVLDIDIPNESLLDKVLPNAKKRTLVVQTGSGKYHIYTRVSNLPKSCKLENELGRIEIKSEGTYVVGISSIHPDTDREYKVISETMEITQIDFKEIQNNLKQIGFGSDEKVKGIELVDGGIEEGSRHNNALSYCNFLLFTKKLDVVAVKREMIHWNQSLQPPLPEDEISRIIDDCINYHKNKSDGTKEDSSSKLFELANSQIKKIVISQNNSNEVYAIIENNGNLETLNLSFRRAIYWLNNLNHKQNIRPKIHSDDFYKNILNAIISKAQMDETCKEKVYNRTAFLGDVLYYDLCTPDWKIVKITKNDIDIIPFSESTPIFRRTQSGYAQINPVFEESDSLEKIANLLRIKDVQLFKVHLVCMFLESIPVPIMFFDGEAGSMKTTTTAAIKRIIDPNGINNEDNCNSISTRNDDLIVQLNNRYVSAFDNVTKISQEMSNVLCRAITGSGNVKRELYTNSEETILNFRRKIILNGIVPSVDYPDLQDRMISYDRIPLQNNQRLTDKKFQERFNLLLPSAIGQIFKTIQKSLIHYEEVNPDVKPKTRLADFEIWGEIISRDLGYDPNSFLEKFYEKQKQSSIESIDSQPLVAAIEGLLDNRMEYESTMTNCFKSLTSKARELFIDTNSKYVRFPKAPNQLSKQLTILKPTLRKLGIEVETYHYVKNDGKYTKNSSMVTFRKLGVAPSPASLPSPQSTSITPKIS